MKTNNECIREILKKVEMIPCGESIVVSKLAEELSEFTIEDILAMVTLLNREHFIIIVDKAGYNDSDVFRENKIKCLTERGYRNLDVIREDRIWNLMKEKLSNFDDLSFFIIASLASKIVNDEHNKLFNIDSKSFVEYARW